MTRLLSAVREKVILHWLGEMFDPELAGYWGNHDIDIAMSTLLDVLKAHVAKVDGVKISLLDRGREEYLRKPAAADVEAIYWR